MPVICHGRFVCDDDLDACVDYGDECSAPYECDDGDACTDYACIDGRCVHIARECEPGYECDSQSGECVPLDEPCLSQCELGSGQCLDRNIEDFADYDTTLAEFHDNPVCVEWLSHLTFMLAGECGDGLLFLYVSDANVRQVSYFELSDGAFIALTTKTSRHVLEQECDRIGYWPQPVECANATVTEVICGSLYVPGDEVRLPGSPQ
jgi:hypothetical protein